ncbi:hypothetical protein NC651_030127 [Populus alba x Populus x berolinensis]|nr:hypothetical protein NC651_030127 [Populus alba x Populus x berolinensis]
MAPAPHQDCDAYKKELPIFDVNLLNKLHQEVDGSQDCEACYGDYQPSYCPKPRSSHY